jgi:L-ribulose-5-phosphate 3-epimerase
LEKELEVGNGHIVAVHVKDTVPGEFRRVPFGQGTVPFTKAFSKLASMGYQAPVLIEMWNDDSADSLKIITEARKWVGERMLEGYTQAAKA